MRSMNAMVSQPFAPISFLTILQIDNAVTNSHRKISLREAKCEPGGTGTEARKPRSKKGKNTGTTDGDNETRHTG